MRRECVIGDGMGRTHFEVADVTVVHQTLYGFLLEIQGSVCVCCLFVHLFVCVLTSRLPQ